MIMKNVHCQCTAKKPHFQFPFSISIKNVHLFFTLTMYISKHKLFLYTQTGIHNAQLSELLHMTHEKPIMVRDENSFLKQQTNDNWSPGGETRPKFVGQPTTLNLHSRSGMPKHIQHNEIAALFRVINTNATKKTIV
jgi:hypothetical protein